MICPDPYIQISFASKLNITDIIKPSLPKLFMKIVNFIFTKEYHHLDLSSENTAFIKKIKVIYPNIKL